MNAKEEKKPYLNEDGNLCYDLWVSNGFMIFNRDALDYSDSRQTYNYLKAYGFTPEDYGIFNLRYSELTNLSRQELLSLCIEQKELIAAYESTGMF